MIIIVKEKDNIDDKNDLKESAHKDKPIYVKVSDETRGLIDKYKTQGTTISDLVKNAVKCFDDFNSISPEILAIIERYKEEDELNFTFIERAIKYFGEQKNLDRDLWVRARDEMKMCLIGKTTFNQLIHAAAMPEDARERAYHKNVAFDLILWHTGKPLKSLKVEEIINTIAKIWVVANYFYAIDVHKENDEYHILFKHRQNRRFSEYWLGYFTTLFNSEDLAFKCSVEGMTFDESISMIVKVGYKK
ncbi:MAG: hypothetical protein ACXAC5_12960 [Promethearchaeota archaeon]|jgi:hypothetical protein